MVPVGRLEALADFVFGDQHELLDVLVLDGVDGVAEAEPFDAFHPLLLGGDFSVVESADEIDLGGHEDEFVDATVLEVDFAEPSEDLDVEEARLLADFADGGLASGFAWFDVAFGDGPATFGVLNEENVDVFLVGAHPKNNPAGGWFTDDFLDGRFFENFGGETREGVDLGAFGFEGESLRDFALRARVRCGRLAALRIGRGRLAALRVGRGGMGLRRLTPALGAGLRRTRAFVVFFGHVIPSNLGVRFPDRFGGRRCRGRR